MRKQRTTTNAVASSSSASGSVLGKKRSRKQQEVLEHDDDDELSGVVGAGKQVQEVDGQDNDDDDDEDDDEFEIDTGSSNGDLDDFVVASEAEDEDAPVVASRSSADKKKKNGKRVGFQPENEDDGGLADSESEQDSQAGLDLDDDEGYNSSDIDALEDDDDVLTPATSVSSTPDLETLIKRHTSKPSEAEYQGDRSVITGGRALTGDGRWGTDKFSSAKEGSGRLRASKFVEGSFVREYDEFEAGYGSESSTEEVRFRVSAVCSLIRDVLMASPFDD